MFYSFRQTNARFILNLSSRTLECQITLTIYCMTHAHIRVISPIISNLETHAEQSRARASFYFIALIRIRHSKDIEAVFR